MPNTASVDQTGFKRILVRNVTVPLAAGVASALIFVAVISYLLSVMAWVEHSERVIGHASEVAKLAVDQESGLRGFLLTRDESFLAPYTVSKSKSGAAMQSLVELVSDNPAQLDRLRQISALQRQWDDYAREVIALRRSNGDYMSQVMAGRGKIAFDAIRAQFEQFQEVEQGLLKDRNDSEIATDIITNKTRL